MYLVIGGNGYLGSYVIKNILSETEEDIIATSRVLNCVKESARLKWEICDIQKDIEVERVINICKDTDEKLKVVFLAAFHHPDKVQSNRSLAWNINVVALAKFLNRISDVTDTVYYASTDSVYGESIDGYHFKESDALNPVNFYGHCKCAAESLMIHRGFNVVRFPFLISPSLVYKKHFYDEIRDNLATGEIVEMYEDSYRSSLSFDNAGFLLIHLMEKGNNPCILNVCGDKDYSKYDVGIRIAEIEGLDKELVKPISIKNVQTDNFRTKRATSTLMDNSLLKSLLAIPQIDMFEKPVLDSECL